MVVDEAERQSIGRPWLTLVIDVATRAVLGFYLSLDAPSSTSVALALSHAVLPKRAFLESEALAAPWPMEGLPETIHLDNAKEFHSNALKRGCRDHGMSLTYRPPRTPHFGGHIERLIGTMMGELHLLPGTTFSSTGSRGNYKPSRMASLTMGELQRWLTIQIVDIYHQRVHRSIGEPPIKAWEKRLASGQAAIRHPRDAQKFYVDFLPGELRMIRRDGIQIFGIHYWDSVLSPFAGRSKDRYLIRYDPRDLSHVYMEAAPNGDYLKVPYRDIGHPAITLHEHRSSIRQLKSAKHFAINEGTIFSAILEQRELVLKACEKTASARRAREKLTTQKPPTKNKQNEPLSDSQSEPLPERITPYKVEVWERASSLNISPPNPEKRLAFRQKNVFGGSRPNGGSATHGLRQSLAAWMSCSNIRNAIVCLACSCTPLREWARRSCCASSGGPILRYLTRQSAFKECRSLRCRCHPSPMRNRFTLSCSLHLTRPYVAR